MRIAIRPHQRADLDVIAAHLFDDITQNGKAGDGVNGLRHRPWAGQQSSDRQR